MHVINSLGDELDLNSAKAIVTNLAESEAVDRMSARALLCAVSDRALRTVPREYRNTVRADIAKQILIHLV